MRKRNMSPDQFAEWFWSKVDRSAGPDACWPWMGYRGLQGYGTTGWGGRTLKVHRIAYELTHGPIPDDGPGHHGWCVLHRCDNPPCCNVERCLWLGTNTENMADMMAKGRGIKAVGDRNGTRLHPESRPRGDQHHARLHPDRVLRGEAHGKAVLSVGVVREIRASVAGESGAAIARRLGLNQFTVYDIIHRRTWTHADLDHIEAGDHHPKENPDD